MNRKYLLILTLLFVITILPLTAFDYCPTPLWGDPAHTFPATGTVMLEGGPQQVVLVPNVVSLQRSVAEQILARHGLRCGRVVEQVSDQPPGTVISQSPVANGRVRAGSAVSLVVATSPPPPPNQGQSGQRPDGPFVMVPAIVMTTVPSLMKQTVENATTTLDHADLVLGRVTERVINQQPETVTAYPLQPGTIIDQMPKPNKIVAKNSAVDVVVAKAPLPVIVPGVIGLYEEEAKRRIGEVDLRVGRIEQVPSNQQPGIVIRQSPNAGTAVNRGSHVNLYVSRGGQLVEVPNVVGMERPMADNTLGRHGLEVGRVEYVSSNQKPGTVARQHPGHPQMVTRGYRVDLYVARSRPQEGGSSGPESGRSPAGPQVDVSDPPKGNPPVEVPNLIGLKMRKVKRLLRRADLRLGQVTEEPSQQKKNTVIRQEPEPGHMVARNSAVDVVMAVPPPQVEVPEVRGLELNPAGNTIVRNNLLVGRVEEVASDRPPGTVISQDPLPGTEVEWHSRVNLVIAQGLKVAVVPYVMGMDQATAERMIRSAGLLVGQVMLQPSTQPSRTVTAQHPRPSTKVERNSLVDLTIAQARPRVIVPDVVGLPRRDAERIVANAGLRLGGVRSEPSDKARGTVLGQHPPAGFELSHGSQVDLTVAGMRLDLTLIAFIAGIFILAGGSLLLVRAIKKGVSGRGAKPIIQVEGYSHMGSQQSSFNDPTQPQLEIRLRAVGDIGVQEVSTGGSLIIDERNDHDES